MLRLYCHHSLTLSLGTQCHRGISYQEKQDTEHFDTFNQSWAKLKGQKEKYDHLKVTMAISLE